MWKKFKRRGFMDQLYFYNLRFAWHFTIACFVLNALSGYLNITELAIITYGMPVVWGELTLHTGFMIKKAEHENARKFKFGTNGKTIANDESCTGATEREEI